MILGTQLLPLVWRTADRFEYSLILSLLLTLQQPRIGCEIYENASYTRKVLLFVPINGL